ncbi:hypothetical protein [Kribbella sindirgiensis]|uniref:SH3 domain-containing protein n=1 Tax=Kribbella sindirgiensis TaxID=1124744 RepID=A0A4R0I6N4_9ACTN|nr:hypothetical protein [Kribbella sindirgiensis]TCC16298.1 hypothetical protein E0H50_40655 [Kribbella sindirgiensis]
MRKLILLVPLLLLMAGCVQKDSISFGPVEISVDEAGSVEVFVGPSFATPMGDFKVGAAITVIDRQPDDHWYVVIRHTSRSVVTDTVYRIGSASGLRIESGGQLVEEFARHRALIVVPPGQANTIRISPIGDGEYSVRDAGAVAMPAGLAGAWSGAVRGGDRNVWTNKTNEYWPRTQVRLRLFGGEIGQPVGEFSYPAWNCSGVVVLADVGTTFRPLTGEDGKPVVGVRLKHVVLESGRSQRCGGFIKAGQGDPDQGRLVLRAVAGGKLRMDTSLEWTPEATEDEPNPERAISTTLTR